MKNNIFNKVWQNSVHKHSGFRRDYALNNDVDAGSDLLMKKANLKLGVLLLNLGGPETQEVKLTSIVRIHHFLSIFTPIKN
jgi:hypothetical protein